MDRVIYGYIGLVVEFKMLQWKWIVLDKDDDNDDVVYH